MYLIGLYKVLSNNIDVYIEDGTKVKYPKNTSISFIRTKHKLSGLEEHKSGIKKVISNEVLYADYNQFHIISKSIKASVKNKLFKINDIKFQIEIKYNIKDDYFYGMIEDDNYIYKLTKENGVANTTREDKHSGIEKVSDVQDFISPLYRKSQIEISSPRNIISQIMKNAYQSGYNEAEADILLFWQNIEYMFKGYYSLSHPITFLSSTNESICKNITHGSLLLEQITKLNIKVPISYMFNRDGGFTSNVNSGAKKLHQKLKMSKELMQYISTDITQREVDTLIRSIYGLSYDFKKYANIGYTDKDIANRTKAFLDIEKFLIDFNIDKNNVDYETLFFLHSQGYNTERLMRYLNNEIPLTQGITSFKNGATYLKDYVSMSVELQMKYDRYPSSLKKSHDIVNVIYNSKLSEIENEKFQKSMDCYKKSILKNDKYQLVLPEEQSDLIEEGKHMNHCVASYIKRVINGSSIIGFIRDVTDKTKRYATVEINPRTYSVVQVKGFSNSKPSREIIDFASSWSKKLKEI